MYTYHSGNNYGLFAGSLTPTKAGSWTLYAGNGTVNPSYGNTITVVAGNPVNINISGYMLTASFYSTNTINVSGASDAYGNPTPVSLTVNTLYGGSFPSLSNPYTPDVNGNLTVTLPSIPYGKYTIGCTTGSATYTVTSINSGNTGAGYQNSLRINQDGSISVYGNSGSSGYGSPDGSLSLGSVINSTGGTWMTVTNPVVQHPVEIGATGSDDEWAYVLDGNGNLWATGYNGVTAANGSDDMFLPTSNFLYNFTKVLSGVQYFSNKLWYVKTDGTVWYTGPYAYLSGAGPLSLTDFYDYGCVYQPGLQVMINSTTPLTNVSYILDDSLANYMEFATTNGQYYWSTAYTTYNGYVKLGTASQAP